MKESVDAGLVALCALRLMVLVDGDHIVRIGWHGKR
jgi:hypothetical protein